MKFEILIFGVTAFLIANTYYDNKYIDMMKTWKKYYQMIGIGFVGISAYVFLKKYPEHSRSLFTHANGIVKYLPIDEVHVDSVIVEDIKSKVNHPLYPTSMRDGYGWNTKWNKKNSY